MHPCSCHCLSTKLYSQRVPGWQFWFISMPNILLRVLAQCSPQRWKVNTSQSAGLLEFPCPLAVGSSEYRLIALNTFSSKARQNFLDIFVGISKQFTSNLARRSQPLSRYGIWFKCDVLLASCFNVWDVDSTHKPVSVTQEGFCN